MAFVRQQGRQLFIVHGYRDKASGKVKQHVLHTIRSAAEAHAIATPEDEGGEAEVFEQLIERRYPALQVDWEKLRADIANHTSALPEAPPADPDRMRNATLAFVRALVEEEITDEDVDALDAVIELVAWAINRQDRAAGESRFEWYRDSGAAPVTLWTCVVAMRLRGEYELAEALCRTSVDAYPDDPQGYTMLGDLLLDLGRLEEAEVWLRQGREAARRRVPAGMPARQFWAQHHVEAWQEATHRLAECLAAAGDYDDALKLCDECDGRAVDVEAAVRLCRGDECVELAERAAGGSAGWASAAALANYATGNEESAVAWVVYCMANAPAQWAIISDSAAIEALEADGHTLDHVRRIHRLIAPYTDRSRSAVAWLNDWFYDGVVSEFLDALDDDRPRIEQTRRVARKAMQVEAIEERRAKAYGVELDRDGCPIDAAYSQTADELPVSASWDLDEPLVAIVAWLDKPFQHHFAFYADSRAGGSTPSYLRTVPQRLPAVVFKSGAGLAAELAARIGPWPRVRRTDDCIVVELIDGEELTVQLQHHAFRMLRAGQTDRRILVATQRGGTKQKRNTIAAADAQFMTRGLYRESLDFSHYEIDVRLADVAPAPWRSVMIEADATFLDLHDTIQQACAWRNCHLFAFETAAEGAFAIAPFEPRSDGPPVAGDVILCDYFEEHDDCIYVYDFGDCWRHEVRVVARHDSDERFRARLLAGARAFPPEDAGSLPGYEDCCRVAYGLGLKDSSRGLSAEELREWMGDWHPDRFDLAAAAARFSRPQLGWRRHPA